MKSRPAATSQERERMPELGELARMLAAGVLRLRKRRVLVGESVEITAEISAEAATERLEVSGETVLSVHRG